MAGPLFGIIMLTYSTAITASYFMVMITQQQSHRKKAILAVEKSIERYEKDHEGILDWILSIPLKMFSKTVFLLELLFTGFAWAVFIPKMLDLEISDHVWIKGFFLLFGWLMLLFPLTSFGPIYKLIYVLKYIIIRDMFPWITIYITISIGFATAIKLQFDQLPGSTPCVDDEANLTGFLHKTGHTLFELVIMTSGLDTDIKGVRNLECLFESKA